MLVSQCTTWKKNTIYAAYVIRYIVLNISKNRKRKHMYNNKRKIFVRMYVHNGLKTTHRNQINLVEDGWKNANEQNQIFTSLPPLWSLLWIKKKKNIVFQVQR